MSLLDQYPAVSAISGPLAGQLRGQPNAVLTAISEAIISVRALPQPDLQTFIDSLTGAITSDSAANKLKAISALRPFISTWDTTKFGSDNMVTLGLVSNGTYDFTVDWGDGSTPQIVTTYDSQNKTHTYSTSGAYIVKITGTITGWMVDSAPPVSPFDQHAGQHQNLVDISNWGQFKFGHGGQHFRNATNLKITARDIPVLGGSLSNSFAGCRALVTVPNMEKWDTSNVTDMGFLFINSPAFNQDIHGWDTSKVTQMAFVFSGAEAFNQDIGGWDTSSVTGMVYTFQGAKAFNQDISSWKTSKVTEMAGMFYGATAFNNGASGSAVDHPLTFDTAAVTAMNGMFIGAKAFNQPIDHNPDTGSWNTSNVTTMNGMFAQTEAFNQPIGGWDTSKVTDMNGMFDAAHAFNQPINHDSFTDSWNTSLVTDMAYMFRNAWAFNQDIHGWDTSKVTKMHGMFQYAAAFNQNINHSTATGSWNTAAVTNMYGMFNAATAFNNGASGSDVDHPLAFNTAAVTDMSWMFSQASAFNQRLDLSDTSNVANMWAMFHLAAAFNNGVAPGSDVSHPLTFHTPAVLNMASMFQQASAFNQPLHLTDTSKVTLMSHMFYLATAFNNGASGSAVDHPLAFNTAAVTTMESMFSGASAFDQPIGVWNTANVTNMAGMFYQASAFNQPIGGWDTSKVTTMFVMFFQAAVFDQDIHGWVVSDVDNHAYFSEGSPLLAAYRPNFNP